MTFDSRLLSGVSVFFAVVEAGTIARAAEALGVSPSGVSRALARLEARVGARLLARTTRSKIGFDGILTSTRSMRHPCLVDCL